MAWYKSGTVAVTSGGKNVVGTGTAFVDNVQLGDGFLGPDGRLYEIASITSATALVLTANYAGSTASAQSYAITPTQNLVADLAARVVALINQYGDVAANAGTGKFVAGTLAAPSVRGAADENTGVRFAGGDILQLVTGGVAQLQIAANGTPTGPATTLMPVSTAQQTALDAKAALSAPVFRTAITIGATDQAGGDRMLNFTRSGLMRWQLASLSGGTEPGDGSGTDFRLVSYIDDGSSWSTRFRLTRLGETFLPGVYSFTTAASANVVSEASGRLARSTSSVKYKTDIETLEPEYAAQILDFRPVWYRSTCAEDRPDWGWYGLIAEEIGEVAPQYVHWAQPLKTVQREELQSVEVPTGETDAAGQPVLRTEQQAITVTEQVPDDAAPLQAEGVMYERLVVPLLWHVQQLTARVAALEAAQAPASGGA